MLLPPEPRPELAQARARASRVNLLSSPSYMENLSRVGVHAGRDALLADLLDSTGLTHWIGVRSPALATEVVLSLRLFRLIRGVFELNVGVIADTLLCHGKKPAFDPPASGLSKPCTSSFLCAGSFDKISLDRLHQSPKKM